MSASQIQTSLGSLDVTAALAPAQAFAEQAHDAAVRTSDPLYGVAENLPFIGPNLRALHGLSDALDQVGSQAVGPLVQFAGTVNSGSIRGANGGINTDLIVRGDEVLASTNAALVAASATANSLDTSQTLAPVSDAKDQLVTALTKVQTLVTKAQDTMGTVGNVLGMHGTRHYILAFLNNAEAVSLGGGPASLSMLTVDNGQLSITSQGGSQDFPLNKGPVEAVDQNLINIYGTGINSTLNWSTSRPDFPTAANLISAWWVKYKGGPVDGVISVDPIALSYVLAVTGPMTLQSGEVINSENAVSLLLHDIYLRFGPTGSGIEAGTNVFFADAAHRIFQGVTTSKADPGALLAAVKKAINGGDVLAWSSVKDEQALVKSSGLQGVLPTDNSKSTVVGTYFRDVSTSKADYWIQSTSTLKTDVCTNQTNPTFTTSVSLHSTITEEEATTLPLFVVGYNFMGKKISTEVYVYGPVGAVITASQVGNTSVKTEIRSGASDMGRPVARFLIDVAPGETNTLTVTFTGAAGSYGAPAQATTPMLNATKTGITAEGCKK